MRANRGGYPLAAGVGLGLLLGCGEPESTTTAPEPPDAKVGAKANKLPIDGATGLIKAPGWELVAGNCNACHSTRHFLTMRGDRQTWDASITWMQQSQGLWPLAPSVRKAIVDYLATHYGPDQKGEGAKPRAGGLTMRRPPLASGLLPPNPYASGR